LALRKYESEKKLPSFYIFGYLWQLRIESGKFFVKFLKKNSEIFWLKNSKRTLDLANLKKKTSI